jgi:hypothetical protein
MGLTTYGWQWVLMMVGAPGLLISGLLLLAKEPPYGREVERLEALE